MICLLTGGAWTVRPWLEFSPRRTNALHDRLFAVQGIPPEQHEQYRARIYLDHEQNI
jgi:hypothetical protein